MKQTMMTETTETGVLPEDDTSVEGYSEASEEYSHEDLKCQVDEYIDASQDARDLSEKCRDYYDGKQWTEAQIKELKKRKQAPIVVNRIKVKHNGLLGLTAARKADPKAFPRNEKDAGAADAATDGLRYIMDSTNYKDTRRAAANNFFCEGFCVLQVIAKTNAKGEADVDIEHIAWDRAYYDPYSTRKDFDDATFKGYLTWMDDNAILRAFRDSGVTEEMLAAPEIAGDGDTFEDKPRWSYRHGKRKRHLVATHYFQSKVDGRWMLAIFTGGTMLLGPMESPYLDEHGTPECPLEFQAAYIDRDNNRYGELVSFLPIQDEINHRRSKALFLLSQRQTYGNRGAVKDVKKAKTELAKPDGHLEVGQGEYGKDFGILPTGEMAAGQLELLQEAKQEMDAQSYNAQLSGERGTGDISGVALGKLQQAGVIELNDLFEDFAGLELRIYRKAWNRARQLWTAEKWVRVTDDQKDLRWVGFNIPVTMQEFLQETMDDDAAPYEMKLAASAQMIVLEQTNPEGLKQVVFTKNNPAELDMDIILDQSYDSVNTSQEQLDAILQFGAQSAFDLIDLLTISNISGKDKLIEKLERRKKEAGEAAVEAAKNDPNAKFIEAKAAEAMSNAELKKADTVQTMVETEQLMKAPVQVFKGNVSA